MPPVDHRALAIEALYKKILASTFNRQLAEQFIAECAKLIQLQSALLPNQILERCVQEHGKKLAAMNRAGWARLPQTPDKFILVDPTGCVIVDFDGKEISPPMGANLRPIPRLPKESIRSRFAASLPASEGNIAHFYLDVANNVTIGIGHKVEGESDARAIHRQFGFYERDPQTDKRTSNKADIADVLADFRVIEARGTGKQEQWIR